jgi:hypothetical protein
LSRLGRVGSLAGRLFVALVFASAATYAGGAAAASGATYAKGVDVSHFNGTIDWLSVTSASYRFAYAKATEGKTIGEEPWTALRRLPLRAPGRLGRRGHRRKRDRAGGLLLELRAAAGR